MGRSDRKQLERKESDYKRDKKERAHKHQRREHDEDNRDRSRERRSRSPRGRQRGQETEQDVKPKIKQEKRDRGYEQYKTRGEARTENVRIKQEVVMTIKQEREYNDQRRRENKQHQPENPFQSSNNASQGETGEASAPPKEKPNFETSGALTEDTNTYRGVVIKYNEPPEARKPKRKWRFYIFKGERQMPVLHIHRQSAYLLGRDRKIADIPVDHPSCSKQHAVLQYRLAEFTRDDGTIGRRVRPYIIDLESANGTFLNNKQIEAKRYYELQEKDVLKFGYSSRDYVLLHENSKDDEDDDD